MAGLQNIFQSEHMSVAILLIVLILVILYVINIVQLHKMNKNYHQFLKKLGKGENIEESLKEYIEKVDEVSMDNKEIIEYYQKLDQKGKKCMQKIGIVRYTAYEKMGSDLSFALAILDAYNNGVVLNGIYSTEGSNIFAKPIQAGKSTYTLSSQEQEALQKAMQS